MKFIQSMISVYKNILFYFSNYLLIDSLFVINNIDVRGQYGLYLDAICNFNNNYLCISLENYNFLGEGCTPLIYNILIISCLAKSYLFYVNNMNVSDLDINNTYGIYLKADLLINSNIIDDNGNFFKLY